MHDELLRVFAAIPRQGPGDVASSVRALDAAAGGGPICDILDVGCGTGGQTLVLAERTGARITAVDLHRVFLDRLEETVRARGLGDRVTVRAADMRALPFADASFDLIWAEGSAYIMGLDRALADWRRLLRAGGRLAFTEMVWCADAPAEELRAFLGIDDPAAHRPDRVIERVAAGGYRVLDRFLLPWSAWTDGYYTPLRAALDARRARGGLDPDAAAALSETDREIELMTSHPGAVGYLFVVCGL